MRLYGLGVTLAEAKFNCTMKSFHSVNLTRLETLCDRYILDEAPVPSRSCKRHVYPLVEALKKNSTACDTCLAACAHAHALAARGEPLQDIKSCSRISEYANYALAVAVRNFNGTNERIQYGKIADSVQHQCLAEARKIAGQWAMIDIPKKSKSTKLKSLKTAVFIHQPQTADAAINGAISMWKCWAGKYGLSFVLDETPSERPDWSRWRQLRRVMDKYDWVISVAPQVMVEASCWNLDGLRILENMYSKYHVIIREVIPPQPVTASLVIVRNSPAAKWVIDRTIDQQVFEARKSTAAENAFFESLTWLLELETRKKVPDPNKAGIKDVIVAPTGDGGRMYMLQPVAEHTRIPYRSDCVLSTYDFDPLATSRCFWYWSSELAGTPGARTSGVVGFVDPRVIDIANSAIDQQGFIVDFGESNLPAAFTHIDLHQPALTCHDFETAFANLGTCVANNDGGGGIRGYCAPYVGVC